MPSIHSGMEFPGLCGPIGVNVADADALLDAVDSRLRAGQGFALATLNLDHLVKLGADAGFARAYSAQDLVVADGNPVVWLSRLARRPVALLPGSDLVVPLVQAAVSADRSIAMVGTTDAALAATAAALRARVPEVQIAACIAPRMGLDPEGVEAIAMLEHLRDIDAGLCLVALGAPKQERFAALGRQLAPRTGFASIGAGLDFLAGTQKRAPRWVRALALEWLWRMLSNPRRLALRYGKCALALPGLVRHALGLRRKH